MNSSIMVAMKGNALHLPIMFRMKNGLAKSIARGVITPVVLAKALAKINANLVARMEFAARLLIVNHLSADVFVLKIWPKSMESAT